MAKKKPPAKTIPAPFELDLSNPEQDASTAASLGDHEGALALLMSAYGDRVYRFCRLMLGDAELAQDAHLFTFVDAYESLPRRRGAGALRPWIFGLAFQRCLTAKRHHKHQAAFEPLAKVADSSVDVAGEDALEPPVSHETRSGEASYLEAALPLLAELPPKRRAALLLRALESMSDEELVQVHGDRTLAAEAPSEDFAVALAESAALEPSGVWQTLVRTMIERRRKGKRGRRRLLGLYLPVFLGLLGLTVLFVLQPWQSPPALLLQVEIVPGPGGPRAAGHAKEGDLLRLKGRIAEETFAELRVYREEDEMLLRCSTISPCSRLGDQLEATWVIPASGSYQAVLFTAASPLPVSSGDLHLDANQVLAMEGKVRLGPEIEVP